VVTSYYLKVTDFTKSVVMSWFHWPDHFLCLLGLRQYS